MKLLILTILNALFSLSSAVPLDSIDSPFLSSLNFNLREEPELTRCIHVWQAVDAKQRDVEMPIDRLRAQPTDIREVDLETMRKLRDIHHHRKTIFGPSVIAKFVEDCVKVLEEALKETGKNDSEQVAEESRDNQVDDAHNFEFDWEEQLKREIVKLKAERARLQEEASQRVAELEDIKSRFDQILEQAQLDDQKLRSQAEQLNSMMQKVSNQETKLAQTHTKICEADQTRIMYEQKASEAIERYAELESSTKRELEVLRGQVEALRANQKLLHEDKSKLVSEKETLIEKADKAAESELKMKQKYDNDLSNYQHFKEFHDNFVDRFGSCKMLPNVFTCRGK